MTCDYALYSHHQYIFDLSMLPRKQAHCTTCSSLGMASNDDKRERERETHIELINAL